LRLRVLFFVRGIGFKSEKGSVKGRRLCARVRGGRSLRGLKSQESRRSLRPGLIIWVAKEEDGFPGGMKPLERRYKAGMVLW